MSLILNGCGGLSGAWIFDKKRNWSLRRRYIVSAVWTVWILLMVLVPFLTSL